MTFSLEDLYDWLNVRAFGGRLRRPWLAACVAITDGSGRSGRLGGWSDDGTMLIRADCLAYPLLVLDLLTHEMVHQAVGSSAGHGPEFVHEAGVVARRLDIPAPGSEGSCWPMLYRPKDFYGPGVVYGRDHHE